MLLASTSLAEAGVSSFWQQLGPTSASGNGVSQTPSPKAVFDGTLAVGGDGRPVVVYTEYPDANASQGAITVKRWTGATWEVLSGASGIGQGYEPQVRIAANGAIYVAWLKDDSNGNTEIRLRVRTASTFDQLGGSDSPGGISGTNPGITVPFSLALDGSGNPLVAFLGLAESGVLVVTETPELIDGTAQVYVRRWTGSAWEFMGSDFTGGGASNAVSFVTGGGATILHDVDSPSLTVDDSGAPVVAFTYFTTVDGVTSANTDIYVTRWNGSTWTAVGPAVPAGESPAGVGGAGGVSGSADGSFNPSLAADATGRLALAWEEEPAGGGVFVWVRVWNGVDTWEELAGSATGSGFAAAGTTNTLPSIAIDPSGRPVVAWQALTALEHPSEIFVLRWNGTDAWEELGLDSASNAGISDAALDAMVPALALSPAGGTGTAGVPTVAWLDVNQTGSAQVFLRQLYSGPTVSLTVTVTGDGTVTSNPIGVECTTDTCVTEFPSNASVTLVPHGGATGAFGSWGGACSGSGACTVVMSTPRSVNASFVAGATLTVDVLSPGGRVSSSPAGIANCVDSCSANFPLSSPTPVTLTASVVPGGAFTGWGGACAFRGTNTTCALSISGNVSATASFTLKTYHLNVTSAMPAGTTGQGTVGAISGPVIACAFGDTCSTDVGQGTTVLLVAEPDAGNRFLNWSGGPCNGRTTLTCSFVVTANATITALFRGATGVQVLKAGNGTGTVTGTGFNCGADCFESVFLGTSVTLTPTPGTGSVFAGWTGDVCNNQASGPCTFSASGISRTVSATFQLKKQHLAVSSTGAGHVTGTPGSVDCGSGGGHTTCGVDYDYGTTVVLTPFSDVDSTLASWTGCTSLNGSSCTVLMTANRTVAPKFVTAHTLDVTASGNGSGKITSATPPGLTCVSNCSVSRLFPATASVVLTPQPAVGTNFRWTSGVCSGTAACTTLMSANRSAIGEFRLNRHSLTVTNPLVKGRVVNGSSLPGGAVIDCGDGGSACSGVFDYGTPVTLQATPNTGFLFVNWTGTVCAGSANTTCAFQLKANVTATPNFRARTLVTVVKAGNGVGTVSGPGISCGADCSENEFDGKSITLTAAPAVGSRLVGLSGACVSSTSPCSFVPSGDSQTVTATFALIPYTVTVANRTNGAAVSTNALPDGITCGAPLAGGGSDCGATLDYGTSVVLQATPITGSRFVNWTGTVCAGSTNATCAFKIPAANVSVSPNFKDITTLTLNKSGLGTIVSTPAGISCGTACSSASFDFARGVTIKLTPTPPVGWNFDGFSGDCSGLICSLNASAPTAMVDASFSIQHRRLAVTVVGNGTVSGTGVSCDAASTPCLTDYDYGTSVPLTAVAAAGYRFTGWSQDCTGTGACSPLMTANHSVTATFKAQFGLTVTKSGNSTGTITASASPAGIPPFSCGVGASLCSSTYLQGQVVTLTRSAPITGTTFRWGDDCAFRGTNATCALTMSGNVSVSADYSLQRLGLTVVKNGGLLGTVTGLSGTINCGGDCAEVVDYGTPVTLVATASSSPAAEFVSWTGCTTAATNASCSFTMTANRTVMVTFRPLVTSLELKTISSAPLAVSGVRQVSAVATFTDGSQQDVTTQATWLSQAPTIASVSATGLVTGKVAGNTSVTGSFRLHPGDTPVTDSLPVTVDALQSIQVACEPYGGVGDLTCLPSGLNFSVHCQALGTFTNAGAGIDVTDQATWSSSNAAVAQSTGLVAFNGPIRQSFRMIGPASGTGIAILKAVESGKTSPATGTPGIHPWAVQGVPATVTDLDVTPPSGNVGVNDTLPLTATATVSGAVPACATPQPRDFSRAVTWTSSDDDVADVSFFGEVTGIATGNATVTASYGIGNPPPFSGTSAITVVP
jgi:hypothetical protein